MTERAERQIRNHLAAIIDASVDLRDHVGIPETAAELVDGPRVVQLAFCECVRRCGESVALIDAIDASWLAERFPELPWRDIKATRNLLTHHYWTVDYAILHRIAVHHLPEVTAAVAAFLERPDPLAPPRD